MMPLGLKDFRTCANPFALSTLSCFFVATPQFSPGLGGH
jgi:hypothetical protein